MPTRNPRTHALWLALAAFAAVAAAPALSHAGTTAKMKFVHVSHPTPAQTTGVRLALQNSEDYELGGLADCMRTTQPCYGLATVDMNDDGRQDLLVYYGPVAEGGFCGFRGCGGAIVMATSDDYAQRVIELPVFNQVDVLGGKHHGMQDLKFDIGPVWTWDGSKYQITRRAK